MGDCLAHRRKYRSRANPYTTPSPKAPYRANYRHVIYYQRRHRDKTLTRIIGVAAVVAIVAVKIGFFSYIEFERLQRTLSNRVKSKATTPSPRRKFVRRHGWQSYHELTTPHDFHAKSVGRLRTLGSVGLRVSFFDGGSCEVSRI